ncbi:MAG: hypothetical protein PWQ12_269 [Clostridiales bacterium]|nr:hypothetical protein [Clostridiales bacterium]
MNYQEVIENAKKNIGSHCKVCKECNGLACKGVIPGPGGKGTGIGFIRNYEDLKKIAVRMDTLHDVSKVDTSLSMFGETFDLPVFAGPIGAVTLHYSDAYNDLTYSAAVIEGCKAAGSIAFTGDGVKAEVFNGTADAIKANQGFGVPTIKPWRVDEVIEKIRIAEAAGAKAVAMDVDAAGLAILAMQGKPVGPVSVENLKKIVQSTKLPFIVKGIMTADGAKKAMEAGVYGIVVSNHGGRVLDETQSTVSVLPEIAEAVGGKVKIIIDGGIRTGIDVFKVLALGADAAIVARPFVTAVYGGGSEGVSLLVKQLKSELENVMLMTGCADLASIDASKIK